MRLVFDPATPKIIFKEHITWSRNAVAIVGKAGQQEEKDAECQK